MFKRAHMPSALSLATNPAAFHRLVPEYRLFQSVAKLAADATIWSGQACRIRLTSGETARGSVMFFSSSGLSLNLAPEPRVFSAHLNWKPLLFILICQVRLSGRHAARRSFLGKITYRIHLDLFPVFRVKQRRSAAPALRQYS